MFLMIAFDVRSLGCVLLCFPLIPRLGLFQSRGGRGVLPYLGYIGMCRCKGYGFQAVYSRIGYINQSVWV